MNTTSHSPVIHQPLPQLVLRWLARRLSILTVGFVLMLAFGEGMHLSKFTNRELVMAVFFPFGLCLGQVLAWWREGLGGGIVVASLAGFYFSDWLASSHFPRGFFFFLVASPGFLFLASWLWGRLDRKAGK